MPGKQMQHYIGEHSMKWRQLCSVTAILFAFIAVSTAAPVRIRVTDPAGVEGVDNVLIIVQALNGKGEVSRDLSNSDGRVAALELPPGVYRVIAVFPYGYWFTQVREFVVADSPIDVVLNMHGAVVDTVQVLELELQVTVIDRDGKPVENALILGRDPEAKFNHWTRSDTHGHATVKIGVNGADVVAIYKGQVISKHVDIPFESNICTTDNSFQRRLDKAKQSLHEVTLRIP